MSKVAAPKNQWILENCSAGVGAAWPSFAELGRLLDVPAEAITELLPNGLALLCHSLGATQAVLTVQEPGEKNMRVCASLLPVDVASWHPIFSRVGQEFLNQGQGIFLDRGTSQAVALVAVPLRHEGKCFGALCVEIPQAQGHDRDAILDILTVAAALFTPGLRARATALHVPTAESTHSISNVLQAVGMVGSSEAMHPVYIRMAQAAPTSTTVLLRGKSGTGKELVARALHAASPRAGGPFVSLSCAALPESLIESELFGHEKGAFTGATSMRKGRFELAHGGTLFLDEIGELPLLTQVKLLRVLQERSLERLGGMESRQIDIRIITATNRPLEDMVEDGRFRRDLYYRLNVFSIYLPSLQERKSDILLLAQHFLAQFAARYVRSVPSIALSAADMLHRYTWPGNIRELENMMERAVLLMEGSDLLLPQHLPPELHSATCPFCATSAGGYGQHAILSGGSLPERLEELERVSIIEALTAHRGHIGQAAIFLGLTERVLYLRMRKFGLSFKDYRKDSDKIN